MINVTIIRPGTSLCRGTSEFIQRFLEYVVNRYPGQKLPRWHRYLKLSHWILYVSPRLEKRFEIAPFCWTIVILFASFRDLAENLYPYLVPSSVTITHAAASSKTLVFMLTGIGMLITVMTIYNTYLIVREPLNKS